MCQGETMLECAYVIRGTCDVCFVGGFCNLRQIRMMAAQGVYSCSARWVAMACRIICTTASSQ
jgi:hypothetical protein